MAVSGMRRSSIVRSRYCKPPAPVPSRRSFWCHRQASTLTRHPRRACTDAPQVLHAAGRHGRHGRLLVGHRQPPGRRAAPVAAEPGWPVSLARLSPPGPPTPSHATGERAALHELTRTLANQRLSRYLFAHAVRPSLLRPGGSSSPLTSWMRSRSLGTRPRSC